MNFFISEDDMCTTQKLNLARVQKWIIANGNVVVEDLQNADKVLCMTCNGWSLLEEASYDRIKLLSQDYSKKMIVMGCVNDAHPDKVKEIWSGPTVRTAGDKPYSFSGIEQLFPEFNVKIEDIPANYLVNLLSMNLDFSGIEKQTLLESPDLDSRLDDLICLMGMSNPDDILTDFSPNFLN